MYSTIRVSALSLLLLCLFGCAAPPAKKDPRDPWERLNRTTYKFNTCPETTLSCGPMAQRLPER